MMKRIGIILLFALAACTARAPLSQRIVESEIARCPDATYLDGQQGKLKWNYTTGLELNAFLEAGYVDYVSTWYDAIIDSTGAIGGKYRKVNYSSDHICPGVALMKLYETCGEKRYKTALDTLYSQIRHMPRTPEGGFWHKKIYPNQMWLDGLYMVEPFYAAYTCRFVSDPAEKQSNLDDITAQFSLIREKTCDSSTGLLRHAWDSSREMFWCDKTTGRSAHCWGRALGWYMMALVDVIEIIQGGECRDRLAAIFKELWETIPAYADPVTGMWYQVMDAPGREGNYLEASCSAMFAYSRLKGVRLGLLQDKKAAVDTFKGLLRTFVSEKDGLVTLHSCCEVAGLGGKQNRSGDYDYYINERVCDNDPKGIGPLIMAALEYEKL